MLSIARIPSHRLRLELLPARRYSYTDKTRGCPQQGPTRLLIKTKRAARFLIELKRKALISSTFQPKYLHKLLSLWYSIIRESPANHILPPISTTFKFCRFMTRMMQNPSRLFSADSHCSFLAHNLERGQPSLPMPVPFEAVRKQPLLVSIFMVTRCLDHIRDGLIQRPQACTILNRGS